MNVALQCFLNTQELTDLLKQEDIHPTQRIVQLYQKYVQDLQQDVLKELYFEIQVLIDHRDFIAWLNKDLYQAFLATPFDVTDLIPRLMRRLLRKLCKKGICFFTSVWLTIKHENSCKSTTLYAQTPILPSLRKRLRQLLKFLSTSFLKRSPRSL